MQAPDWFWKWVALAAVLIFLGYNFLMPNLLAGRSAVQYINACVQAGLCPSLEVIDARLKPPALSPAPKPSPSPTPAPSGKP